MIPPEKPDIVYLLAGDEPDELNGFDKENGSMQSIMSFSSIKALFMTFTVPQYPTWFSPHLNDGNEKSIPQQGHLTAQGADCLGFQPLMDPEQEQSQDEPGQDQGQLDLNNLPDNPRNEGLSRLTQETRRSKANKGSTKPGPNLSVRRRRAADSANFASGRHMLMQVWRHQQGEQQPKTSPQ
ncbi:MAG: hypothetical protein EZS28_009846 [Streblomastix strix]|uniref:Uncharacterized protein n=1 Tax=Streblomastix strix TaxID=222440 RepID=A0A5J4WK16_9EUKA|nr:MAG: hypothetical protein EZS28_009846 [Streblomastix strix]